MRMFSSRLYKPLCIAAIAVFAFAGAQLNPAPPPGADTIYLSSGVGSFKIVGGSPTAPPVGRLEVSFTGTLLLSDPQGDLQVTGNLKKEFEAHKKVVYHGTGKVVINGKFFSAQWFGKDMTATFKCTALVRAYGEFDKNLDTGSFWYGNELTHKQPWMTGGRVIEVPQPARDRRIVPKVRSSGG